MQNNITDITVVTDIMNLLIDRDLTTTQLRLLDRAINDRYIKLEADMHKELAKNLR